MIRLFLDVPMADGAKVPLSQEDSHYLVSVMRQKVGADLLVFNGRDGEWQANICDAHKRKTVITVSQQTRPQIDEPDVWLVFAPIKKTRIDFMAQKATEMGATKLCPVMTDHTAMDRVKTERLAANAKEAAEQCERLMVPAVDEVVKLTDVLANWPDDRMIMFCDESLEGTTAVDTLRKHDGKQGGEKWAIFIGPEGGFSERERSALKAHKNTVTVSLGPRILRADTAAIAALALWQVALGDW